MISPLGLVAILVGLLVVAAVAIILVGGTAWLVLRKKPKPPADRQASAAVKSRPPVRTPPRPPLHPPARPPGQVRKPIYTPVPPPARPPEALPVLPKRPPQTVIEKIEKEQDRIAQEMSGGVKSWKVLFADTFAGVAQEVEQVPGEKPVALASVPDFQILVDTLNNTAKDVSGGLAGLAEMSDLAGQARREKDSPFLDQFVDLARQLARLVKDDLVAGLSHAEKQGGWPVFDLQTPLLVRSFKDSISSGQAISSAILERRSARYAVMISLSRTAPQVMQARETVEKAYQEVLSSLGNQGAMAGQTTLTRGFDTMKDILSGGSQ
jgi:hypothetical protein